MMTSAQFTQLMSELVLIYHALLALVILLIGAFVVALMVFFIKGGK